jgi:peptide/nickel transport system permease protein
LKAVLRRLAWSLFVAWAVLSLAFAMNNFLPGDPARMVAGVQARPADVARIREQLGLGRPPLVQYALFWRRLVHVGPRDARTDPEHTSCASVVPLGGSAVHIDFGKSFQMRQPVVDILAQRIPRTAALAFAGVAIELLLGLAAGMVAAARRGSWVDRWLLAASVLAVSAPTFLVALGLQYLLAYELKLLPLDGYGATTWDRARSIVLPAVTLGIYGAAYCARLTRDEMVNVLRQDWVRTARAKGAGELRLLVRHGLRNALLPVVTAAGLDLGTLLGGAVVTETVFRWPGIGQLSVSALLNRDGPVILACVVVTAIAVVATNLAVDLIYARLDPRVR